jgi:hypothetical protein
MSYRVPRLLLQGLDSLYVSYFFDMKTGGLDWDDLSYRKERLKQSRAAGFSKIVLGSETFALLPNGKKPYSYIVTAKPFKIYLSENLQPGCHVQFSSEGLWQTGAQGLLNRIEAWASSLGFRSTRPNVVARADWAFDYHVPEVDFTRDHFVSRAIKNATWRERQTDQTFSFGAKDVLIRIYDKVAEIAQQSGKAWFYPLWGQTTDVWRIEFQVRRERLKQAAIGSTEELLALQNDLLRELAGNHTTLRRPASDTNRSRWPMHPLWLALQGDIAALPQTGLVRHIDPQMPLDWRLYQQCKSLVGSLKGIAAVTALKAGSTEAPELNHLLGLLPDLLSPHHEEHTWTHDVEQRIAAHGLGQW